MNNLKFTDQQCHLLTSAVNSHHAAGFNVQHGKGVWINALAFKHLILWWTLEAVILYECYFYYIYSAVSIWASIQPSTSINSQDLKIWNLENNNIVVSGCNFTQTYVTN